MAIKLFNTLSKQKETFIPQDPKKVTMYVCGPTVYSHPHIGNARAALIPDILYRLLLSYYPGDVVYIRNITDVDDKILKAANEQGVKPTEISEKFTDVYLNNMAQLNILHPTHQPKVTEFMDSIISMIRKIIDSGHGYVENNHVLFNTEKDNNYGCLSRKKLDEMIDGARVEVAEYKKSPRDFVLWKPSDNDSFGWDSPWGYGRPGWHIECTSMIKKIIGDDCTLDIHGGGNDLIFPHHENEIAQGSCISTSKYCNYWFHNGIVLVNKKKMSKSLGNVILLDDLLKEHSSSVIRLALLSAHYRQPLNWTEQTIINAKNLYKKLVSAVGIITEDMFYYAAEATYLPFSQCGEIQDILSDDLNTPEVINYLSRLAKTARNNNDDALKLAQSMKFIGLDLVKPSYKTPLDDKYIINLIKQRDEYRIKKDFGSADEVRDKLLDMGIELRDSDGKTTWKYTED
tara:strand:+ start:457 stop:1830 length:1374 start_codon:yes stop_codon:yes gene_type:complete